MEEHNVVVMLAEPDLAVPYRSFLYLIETYQFNLITPPTQNYL